MTAVQDIPLKTIRKEDASLGDYAGKVVLVVNVASKCGLTPQYEGLEKLYTAYKDKGLVVAGFPVNDFAGQEPGTEEEIATFCDTSYAVTFPMFAKVTAVGEDKHPLYRELISAMPHMQGDAASFREKLRGYGMTPNPEPELLWNFEKFLIARDGSVAARFAPTTTPDDTVLIAAIEAELAR